MSASTEELLQQILELEEEVKRNLKLGKSVGEQQKKLILLKEQFELMTETLSKTDKILKG